MTNKEVASKVERIKYLEKSPKTFAHTPTERKILNARKETSNSDHQINNPGREAQSADPVSEERALHAQ